MDNLNLISNFAEFKELKNIDKSTMIGVLEDVFRHLLSSSTPRRATSKSGATARWWPTARWRIPTRRSPSRR